jgi:hypothetical protein
VLHVHCVDVPSGKSHISLRRSIYHGNGIVQRAKQQWTRRPQSGLTMDRCTNTSFQRMRAAQPHTPTPTARRPHALMLPVPMSGQARASRGSPKVEVENEPAARFFAARRRNQTAPCRHASTTRELYQPCHHRTVAKRG